MTILGLFFMPNAIAQTNNYSGFGALELDDYIIDKVCATSDNHFIEIGHTADVANNLSVSNKRYIKKLSVSGSGTNNWKKVYNIRVLNTETIGCTLLDSSLTMQIFFNSMVGTSIDKFHEVKTEYLSQSVWDSVKTQITLNDSLIDNAMKLISENDSLLQIETDSTVITNLRNGNKALYATIQTLSAENQTLSALHKRQVLNKQMN